MPSNKAARAILQYAAVGWAGFIAHADWCLSLRRGHKDRAHPTWLNVRQPGSSGACVFHTRSSNSYRVLAFTLLISLGGKLVLGIAYVP